MASAFDLHVDRMTQYQYEAEFGGQDDGHEATMAELRTEYNRAWPVETVAGDPPDEPDVTNPEPPKDDDDDFDDSGIDDSDLDPDDSAFPY